MSASIVTQINAIKAIPGVSLIPHATTFLDDILSIVGKLDGFGSSLLSVAGKITEQKTAIQSSVTSKVTNGVQGIQTKSEAASKAATDKVIQDQAAVASGGSRRAQKVRSKRASYNRTLRKR